MFLNMPGILIYLKYGLKTKYGLISLEYACIYLKHNIKDTIKKSLDTIYKRGAFRIVSNFQDETFVKIINMVL